MSRTKITPEMVEERAEEGFARLNQKRYEELLRARHYAVLVHHQLRTERERLIGKFGETHMRVVSAELQIAAHATLMEQLEDEIKKSTPKDNQSHTKGRSGFPGS